MDEAINLRISEFNTGFNILSCIAILVVVSPLLIWLIKKIWIYQPFVYGVIALATSRLALFFMWLQLRNGNPDSGKEISQWFNPLWFLVSICLICLLLVCIISFVKYFRKKRIRLESAL